MPEATALVHASTWAGRAHRAQGEAQWGRGVRAGLEPSPADAHPPAHASLKDTQQAVCSGDLLGQVLGQARQGQSPPATCSCARFSAVRLVRTGPSYSNTGPGREVACEVGQAGRKELRLL